MVSAIEFLGFGLNGHQPSNYAAAYLIGNWLFAATASSTRFMKRAVGIDHNTAPREDFDKYGEAAIKAGKLTRERLAQIKRLQAAHENSLEGFSFFVASVLLATHAGVPNATINAICAWYSLSRFAFVAAYVLIESEVPSFLRTIFWWSGNISCITGLVLAGKRL